MKLLIVDASGAALDLALRAKRDGHVVKHFIRQTEKTKHIGRGLVDLVEAFEPHLRWADIVFVADNTRYLDNLDAARKDGVVVVGPTKETAAWELDRLKGMKILGEHKIQTPAFREFTDYDQAIKYVKKENRRFVSKPSGDADKALSYVSKSPADMIYMLERWKVLNKLKREFILQEFIGGTEMAVGAWCGPHGFNSAWCENWEFKKLMDGDMGVATGEQGTVVRYVRKSKLASMVLEPLEEELVREGYTGYIDVNCIIDDQGTPWPLEFTCRPGWPTFNIQDALHMGDCVEWLHDLAQGKDSRQVLLNTIALGVVVSVPDYPYSHLTRKEVIGTPIYGIKPSLWQHLHPCEMMLGEAPVDLGGVIETVPIPVTAGDYVLVMSGIGETVLEAKKRVYARLKRLEIPNSPMWRTDIGDRLSRQLPRLQQMGFAKGMQFSAPQTS